eukprot:CAMPEP_0202053746 /NCGR_PEP_ID=MMETSP0963-20130614/6037_1 /ASSEMBLY_ACC=CAM_ASM_000494 /TAXON_ID=4773 /ORGANISM="Schizochytrium aggregatum, Strain ATCC28209" /LENGTH=61 /DNA_ID=CAMNT_0048619107 /DNA_START=179 /DNA_END=361 /DNA_ORIENTATION=+
MVPLRLLAIQEQAFLAAQGTHLGQGRMTRSGEINHEDDGNERYVLAWSITTMMGTFDPRSS